MDHIRTDLETISKARVFFGHQSVGRNILMGIQVLSEQAGIPLRVVEVGVDADPPPGPGLFHANVGQNLAPESKVDDFATSLGPPGSPRYDAAVLKFCYVDLDENSAATAATTLFDYYHREIREIRKQHPGLAVIHSTMPLMSDPPGWKTPIKRLLGRPTWTDAGNRRRNEFNSLVRARYPADEILDLARIESTLPDGSLSAFVVDGKRVETLALAYTDDGGHLNELGQRHVAVDFLRALAQALRRKVDQSSIPVPPDD